MKTKEEVCQFIISEVRKYLDEGKTSVRFASLTRQTGCSRSTIQRAAQGEISTMRADTVFPMLRLFSGIDKALLVMETLYPEWHKVYGQYWKAAKRKSLNTDQIEWNEVRSKLLDLAGTTGVSEKWIVSKYGSAGLDEAIYLVNAGILKSTAGFYTTLDESYTDTSSKSALERAAIDASTFDHDKIGMGYFWQRFSEALTEKHRKEFIELTRQYISNAEKILDENSKSKETKEEVMILNFFGHIEKINEEVRK